MSEPVRIQRRRTKGWRMPPNSLYVGRPTVWGNPFQMRCAAVTDNFRRQLVEKYRKALCGGGDVGDRIILEKWFRDRGWEGPIGADAAFSFLRGKNLACWCRIDQPCHADVLLEIANR